LNCGHEFDLTGASYDDLGWHTSCPDCKSSFDVDLPHYSAELQGLFDYCRVVEVKNINGYFDIYYLCDPNGNELNTVDTCAECVKAGCHIHTTATNAEMILNGEKEDESNRAANEWDSATTSGDFISTVDKSP